MLEAVNLIRNGVGQQLTVVYLVRTTAALECPFAWQHAQAQARSVQGIHHGRDEQETTNHYPSPRRQTDSRDEYRQGNTMGPAFRHWRRAKIGRRFRLFFRFDSKTKIIIFAG